MAFLDLNGLAKVKEKIQNWVNSRGFVKSVNQTPADENGDVNITNVDYASNLTSDDALSSSGEFIIRPTGGYVNVRDGDAWLSSIRGGSRHDNYIPEELTISVDSSSPFPVTAIMDNIAQFKQTVQESGIIVLEYSGGGWSDTPADYGLTVDGIPADGDTITINYTKENRGTIVVSNPTAFKSTGWNLYQHDEEEGFARVLKYSDDYGFIIGGDYTEVKFSETIDGERYAIEIFYGGAFTIPTDGYIWVTGGNEDTTFICMTHSDWIDGPEAGFEKYAENEIDLTDIMALFEYGLCQVGSVRDYIDFDAQVAVSNIARLNYSEENLITIINSGYEYEYDEDYIYFVRYDPIYYRFQDYDISVSGTYFVSDHGLEFIDGVDTTCFVTVLYGENLKEKLRNGVLTPTPQNLTQAQKNQVYTNLGLATMMGATDSEDGLRGFVPYPPAGSQSKFLRGDGTWQNPPTPANMRGASSSAAGVAGLVPAPAVNYNTRYLRGDGTWQTPPNTNTWRGFQINTYTYGYTVGANNTKAITADNLKLKEISGYTPAGIIRFTSGNGSVQFQSGLRVDVTGSSTVCTLVNDTSSSKSGTLTIKVLFIQG